MLGYCSLVLTRLTHACKRVVHAKELNDFVHEKIKLFNHNACKMSWLPSCGSNAKHKNALVTKLVPNKLTHRKSSFTPYKPARREYKLSQLHTMNTLLVTAQ
jgi:hypothetical protein